MNSLNSIKLREYISDSGITMTAIARKMGISRESLYNKVDKKTEFSVSEINKLTGILGLNPSDRDCIFFGDSRE